MAPVYVALEGPEGSGKSTQAALLATAIDAVLTRETGGTAIGARIRDILHDASVDDLVDEAEALLAAADRAQHVRTLVEPALRSGRHVVSDRSVYSTLAYQGYGRGLDVGELRRINRWAIDDRWPDLVVLLDVDVRALDERMRGRDLDRFELEGRPFHDRVRRGFHELAAAEPERWAVIDGNGPTDDIAAAIREVLRVRHAV